jgi:hypothetical protein
MSYLWKASAHIAVNDFAICGSRPEMRLIVLKLVTPFRILSDHCDR